MKSVVLIIAKIISLMNVVLYFWVFLLSFQGNPFPIVSVVVLNIFIEQLKKIIKERRPYGAQGCDALGLKGLSTGFGMPSGHVAMAVFASMIISQHLKFNMASRLVIGIASGIVMTWSRVVIGCHTMNQSIMGGITGLLIYLLIFKLFESK